MPLQVRCFLGLPVVVRRTDELQWLGLLHNFCQTREAAIPADIFQQESHQHTTVSTVVATLLTLLANPTFGRLDGRWAPKEDSVEGKKLIEDLCAKRISWCFEF